MDLLIRNAHVILTMQPEEPDLGPRYDTSIAVDGGHIVWMGPQHQAPSARAEIDATGCTVLPGLVDCHTHAIWAGSRAAEFQQRLAGRSYTEILEEGGGILSTVAATRACPDAELLRLAVARLHRALDHGITTIEIKSGYGLTPEHEARMLRIAGDAAELTAMTVCRTFLGAHTVPGELRHDRDAYVRQILEDQLPVITPHAEAIDAYVDRGAFTVDEGRDILNAGRQAGLAVRVHAEQVSHTGAAAMAANLGARSADHLEHIDDHGISTMAANGTAAVLLPGAMLYLRDPPPPIGKLREAGVEMAIATDLNPGSSPVANPWTIATLAAINMGLTVEEALLGFTRTAAKILDVKRGVLRTGERADILVAAPPPGEHPSGATLIHHLHGPTLRAVILAGKRVR